MLTRAVCGYTMTEDDEDFIQNIIVIDEDFEPAIDENFALVVEFTEG